MGKNNNNGMITDDSRATGKDHENA